MGSKSPYRNLPDKLELPADWTAHQPDVRASMDLTKTTPENRRHWRDTDSLSVRSSYTLQERKIARERSRLEAENNSWYAGMLRTAANHVVGPNGPRLQVLTTNSRLNTAIEMAWNNWAKAIGFVKKLKIAVETHWRDGEVFGMRASRKIRPYGSLVSLDISLYEGDQCTQPYFQAVNPDVDDGKKIDNLGNPIAYWFLDRHPGDLNIGTASLTSGDWYPAEDVWHLFWASRPKQTRSVPRCSPAIDWLAHMRRFSKATLSSAESAALWNVFMTTTSNQVAPANTPGDFLGIDWERGMLNFMPEGWKPEQLSAEHPATTNEMYQRTELTYFARCGNMPYSLASGSSRDSNFSSAKMDMKNLWEPEVLSEQDEMTTTVMCPTFRWFLDDLTIETDILDDFDGLIEEIEFKFVWPPLPQSDEMEVANAADKRQTSGLTTPSHEHMLQGTDFSTDCEIAARDYGVSVEEYKRALFRKHFGIKEEGAGDPATEELEVENSEDPEEQEDEDKLEGDEDFGTQNEEAELDDEALAYAILTLRAAKKAGGPDRWITIGKGNSRRRILISSSGKILKGPPGLVGETLSSLGTNEYKARQAHAKALGLKVEELSPAEFKKLGNAAHQEAFALAKDEAKARNVSTQSVLENVPSAHQYLVEQTQHFEAAKEDARKITGLNAGRLAMLENNYKDHSNVPRFDESAQAVAMSHPELGLDPDDTNTSAAVWNLIREGKREPPKFNDPEVIALAGEFAARNKQAKRANKPRTDSIDDSEFDSGDHSPDIFDFPFEGSIDLAAETDRLNAAGGGRSQPRDARGRWAASFAAGHGSHSIQLPKNAAKLNIQNAADALKSMGFSLGSSKFDFKLKTNSYQVTNKRGEVGVLTSSELKSLIYQGHSGSGSSKSSVNSGGKSDVKGSNDIFELLIAKRGSP